MTVDEFIETKVLTRHRDIVAMIRGLVREMAPDATEEIRYGIPVYKRKRIFAVISPTKKDITFSFSQGAEFEDAYGLLQGVGTISKHVKIRKLDEANREALRYYIRQALDREAQ